MATLAPASPTTIRGYSINSFARLFSQQDKFTFPANVKNKISNVDPVLCWKLCVSESAAERQATIFEILDNSLLPIGKRVSKIEPHLSISCSYHTDEKLFIFYAEKEITITVDRSNLFTTISRLFERMFAAGITELTLAPKQHLIFTDIPLSDFKTLTTLKISNPTNNADKQFQKFAMYIAAHKFDHLKSDHLKSIQISCETSWIVQFLQDPPNSIALQAPDAPLTLRLQKGPAVEPASSKEGLPMKVKESFSADIEGALQALFDSGKNGKLLLTLREEEAGIFYNATNKNMNLGSTLKFSENVALISEKPLSAAFHKRIITILLSKNLTHIEVCLSTVKGVPTLQHLQFKN